MRPLDRSFEWPTLLLLLGTYGVWAAGTMLWAQSALISVLLTAVAIAQFSSLQHEVLHGHPFRWRKLNEALVFPALPLFVPYERFRDTHLRHHFDPNLTDPYDDPELNYFDPAVWTTLPRWQQHLLLWNNTLIGRMVLGPVIGTVKFIADDFRAARGGDRAVVRAWALNGLGVLMVLVWLMDQGMMPLWAYLLSVYLGFSVLKIRSFLEHRAHETCRARTVVIEDRGPLALLFLNNNFHVVHHMHPQVPWYRLPALYAAHKEHFLRRNESYVYRNYAEIFRRYLFKAKDPVSHPEWPVKKLPAPDA